MQVVVSLIHVFTSHIFIYHTYT